MGVETATSPIFRFRLRAEHEGIGSLLLLSAAQQTGVLGALVSAPMRDQRNSILLRDHYCIAVHLHELVEHSTVIFAKYLWNIHVYLLSQEENDRTHLQ